MTFIVGSGAGFSGDRTDAAGPVVDELIRRGEPSALMFETLGERTLAAGQRARRQNPQAGYEPLLEEYLEPVLADCIRHGIPVLGNLGAANPQAACRVVANLVRRSGCDRASIGLITGDDIRDRLASLDLVPWEAEAGALPGADALISANVYLGAEPLVRALAQGADVVITGRVADPALALAPLVHHFGWAWDDWDRIAAGSLAGHLVECGAQITGGYFADPGYKDVPDLAGIGFPLAEVDAEGRIVITKPRGTGGLVTEQTVKEQLLYEVHDPTSYITPDVILDLSRVRVEQIGKDRVAVTGVRGKPAPERLKATVCYDGGWLGEAEISYAGPNALRRARLAAEMLRARLAVRVPARLRRRFDLIGYVSVFDDDAGSLQTGPEPAVPPEDVRLRLAVEHPERQWVERATQELLALYCTGPAGGGGVRRHSQPRVCTASFLVAREDVPAHAAIIEVDNGRAS
jgi:hypothetical protein